MATKRAKVNKTLEKAKKLVSKKGKKKTKKGSWPEGQARPQSKAYDIENDKTVPAKRTGYRFTKEGAKKLGKQPNDRPTAEEIEKYRNQTFKVKGKVNKSGPKGVGDGSFRYLYIESRADKSDLNKARKLELGGYNPDEMLNVKVYVDVYEDDYEQGEGKHVNSYTADWFKDPNVIAKDLVKYLSYNLYISDNPNDYTIDDDRVIHTDQLQDGDGSPASKGQIERWKEGKEKLYNAHFTILVTAVKNRKPSVDELSKATGIGTYAKGGKLPRINDVREDGKLLDSQMIDEGYVSNAGEQEFYEYKGKKYVITTWNDRAEEHEVGEESIQLWNDDMDKGVVVFDPKEVRDFEKYVFSWYGKNGVAVDDMEENIPATTAEVLKAVSQYLTFCNKNSQKWGGGDSFDREVVHDIIAYNRNPKTTALFYENLIKDMKKTPILEYGGILEPMIGGVNADPRFDIYNTTMFAEKGAEVPEGDEYAKGGMTSIYEIGVRKKGKPGMFVVSVRAKDEEEALKEFHKQNSLLPGAENFKVVGVYKTARRRLEDGGEMAKGGALDWSNDENEALGNWLMKTKDGQSILAKSKNAIELEKNVREYAKKHDGVADLEIDDEDEGLDWVTFDDLMREIKSRYAKGGKTKSKKFEFQVMFYDGAGDLIDSEYYVDDPSDKEVIELAKKLDAKTGQLYRDKYESGEYMELVADYDFTDEYAKGGKTHEQGYDDREDERLAMRHGKIASKHFVGSHKRREHSRRDDARFETRNK